MYCILLLIKAHPEFTLNSPVPIYIPNVEVLSHCSPEFASNLLSPCQCPNRNVPAPRQQYLLFEISSLFRSRPCRRYWIKLSESNNTYGNRIRILTWILRPNRRRCILRLSQTPSRPRIFIKVNPLCIRSVTFLELYFVRRGDPSVESLCDGPITKFIHDRVVNPARSRMEASNGWRRRMDAAVGMCILLQEVQVYAAEDNGGQAASSTSQAMQMIVLRESDLFCTGVRTLAMEGCWQTINSNFQAVTGNKDSLVRPENIIYQKFMLTANRGNAFAAMAPVSVIVSTNPHSIRFRLGQEC